MTATILFAAFLSSAASAAPPAAYYAAMPVAAAKSGKVALKGAVWQCGEAGCTAAATTSRAETVCGSFVRKMGPVSAFRADGWNFDAAALEKCNAQAKS